MRLYRTTRILFFFDYFFKF